MKKAKHYYPDPHAAYALQILILTFCCAVALGIRPVFALFSLTISPLPFVLPLFVAGIILAFFLIPLWIRRLTYTITATTITMTSGIFFIRTKTILLHSLQFSSLIHTPLAKYLGFYFLPLHAYGGSMILIFLRQQDAADICATLYKSLYVQKKPSDQPTLQPPEESHVS